MGRRKVAIQFMSDLHQEQHEYGFTAVRTAPTLILGGDIGRFRDYERYRGLLSRLCAQFELVLLIAGNHEFYGTTRAKGLEAATKLTQDPSMGGRLRFLNRDRVDLHTNITILGCTLHSRIAPGYTRLTNDFKRISEWSVEAHNEEHERDLQWLQASLRKLRVEEPKRQVIVVTHYAPMFERVCHPQNELNDVSQCFSSTALEYLRQSEVLGSVSHWIFGHTHWNVNIKSGNLHVVSNQMHNDNRNLSWWQRKRLYVPFKPQVRLDIELCVRSQDQDRATETLQAEERMYQRLPDIEEPDFYHPYKQGAVQFHVNFLEEELEIEELEIHIVTDHAFGLDVADSSDSVCGLTGSTAHPEVLGLVHNVEDSIVSSVRWPTLRAFLQGWPTQASVAAGVNDTNVEVVSLMQAERLIDTKDVDEVWLKQHFGNSKQYHQAAILLSGKRGRAISSCWDR
ncbi:hypothetical protein TI39_contig5852g00007 [Lecanosticta acicola]|uniref:Calcineurin-like phosphoesterase domain-containing protein n=1 Tax=Lecanosticta acicola TaxID=111012 RepID=A0AAI8Z5F4_9PEZI|nr:hypothetical protein TI39_contig5852g00007 [Lecanosticta acicola]